MAFLQNKTTNNRARLKQDKGLKEHLAYLKLKKSDSDRGWLWCRRNFEAASPEQLLQLEQDNTEFLGYTDYIWQRHCEKFAERAKRPEEDWRDFYARCSGEDKRRAATRLVPGADEARDLRREWNNCKVFFERATPEKLLEMEETQQEFRLFTDYIWQKHCRRLDGRKSRDEDWREFYLRQCKNDRRKRGSERRVIEAKRTFAEAKIKQVYRISPPKWAGADGQPGSSANDVRAKLDAGTKSRRSHGERKPRNSR